MNDDKYLTRRLPARDPALRAKVICALTGALLFGFASHGQETSEDQFRAAFLYHFTQLVSWPETAFKDAKAPLVIGLVGQSGNIRKIQEALNGRQVGSRAVVCKSLQTVSDATNGCHVVYVLDAEKASLKEVSRISRAGVLTVGELKGFLEAEGIIFIYKDEQKLRFRINNEVADRAGLKISSKLLSLSTK